MNISEKARDAIIKGSLKIRVTRNGIIQQITFTVKRVALGNVTYAELATERLIDISELSRIADDMGLPVEAQNGRAFPKGTSATDFQGL